MQSTPLPRRGSRWCALLGLTLLVPLGCASRPVTLTPAERAANLASFDVVWETIRDKHFDPELNGLDWEAERARFRPQVAQADTREAYLAATQALIARLDQTHVGLIPREAYADEDDEDSRSNKSDAGTNASTTDAAVAVDDAEDPEILSCTIGVSVRVIDGEMVVFRVHPDSPAAQVGVEPGWIVATVDGEDMQDHLAAFDPGMHPHALELQRTVHAETPLRGPCDREVRVTFRDRGDAMVTHTFNLVEPPGAVFQFGHMPPASLQFEARRLEDNIGYIHFNLFFHPGVLMPQFRQAIRDFHDANGVIVDLRGNVGGIGALAMGMSGMFVDEPASLGEFITRENTVNFHVQPQARAFTGPLAVLVDGCTASTGEILAAGLRDVAGARVFGEPTAGAALPSAISKLPNGDRLQYIIANYVTTGGMPIEGRGVEVDESIAPDLEAWHAGEDPVLAAAVAWLKQVTR